MAGTGPPPNDTRRRANEPERGEWRATPGIGWQHGEPPPPPTKLVKASRAAWSIWMGAWFAAHWTPEDLPGLRQVIRLYDQVERGEYVRAGELRLQMDNYGITHKGQQDRRWVPPWMHPKPADGEPPAPDPAPNRFKHLKVVNS